MSRKRKKSEKLRSRASAEYISENDNIVEDIDRSSEDVPLLGSLLSFVGDVKLPELKPLAIPTQAINTIKIDSSRMNKNNMRPLSYTAVLFGKTITVNETEADTKKRLEDEALLSGKHHNFLRKSVPHAPTGRYVQAEIAYGTAESGFANHISFSNTSVIALLNSKNLLADKFELNAMPSIDFEKTQQDPLIEKRPGYESTIEVLGSQDTNVLVTDALTRAESLLEDKTDIGMLRKENP